MLSVAFPTVWGEEVKRVEDVENVARVARVDRVDSLTSQVFTLTSQVQDSTDATWIPYRNGVITVILILYRLSRL